MFSFFRKKTPAIDYTFLHTDMHSHLIPGIDDGAKTVEDSVAMIKGLMGIGYKKIITTPHIMSEYYPNTPQIIRAGLAKLKAALVEANIAIEVEAAAEYYVDDVFETLLKSDAELLTFANKYLLIEFSTFAAPNNVFDILFQLNTKGYQPILAHPERYVYYANQPEQFEKIRSRGCRLQVNLLSLTGYYGRLQKKLAIQLLASGQVDYLGTDLHKISQLEKLGAITDRKVRKLLTQTNFKNKEL